MRIALISTNRGTWGGSEELWSLASLRLREAGHEVAAFLARPPTPHPRIEALAAAGVAIVPWSSDSRSLPERAWNRLAPGPLRLAPGRALLRPLRRHRPDFALVSMGGLIEDFAWAKQLRELGIPYGVVLQQASEIDVPPGEETAAAAAMLEEAFGVFFVSEANRRVVREQLGIPLPEAMVVRNPVMVAAGEPLPWPADEGGESGESLHLACPGRLVLRDKGQDLLVRVLALPKWRRRPLAVTLYGSGRHEESLRRMVAYLGLESVRFGGHVPIEEVWRRHPACILPSRIEGLPLALVEAMWCGRPAIVTPAGGSAEVVDDGRTGFVAGAVTAEALDEALERAWERRGEWREMGAAAARAIRELVPPDPAGVFSDQLLARFHDARA